MATYIATNVQFIAVINKNKNSLFWLTFLLFVITMSSAITAKTVIACVGNSITERMPKGGDNYVTQLTEMLGSSFEVINLGVSGVTMSKKSSYPFWKEENFKKIFIIKPDIITLMLGTNDAKAGNWKRNKECFQQDAQAMVDTILTISPRPLFFLVIPPRVRTGRYSMNEQAIAEQIPMLIKVAKKSEVHLIDAYTYMDSTCYFADGVHPNLDGHTMLAKIFFEGLINITSISEKMIYNIRNTIQDTHSNRPVVKIGIIIPTGLNSRVSSFNIFVLDHDKNESSQKKIFLLSGKRITTYR
jgi:lysophospholipase L1-like esterase